VAVWLHGTTVFRGEAASVNDDSEDRAAAFYLAAAGYITLHRTIRDSELWRAFTSTSVELFVNPPA
jgi:hypothetical protein